MEPLQMEDSMRQNLFGARATRDTDTSSKSCFANDTPDWQKIEQMGVDFPGLGATQELSCTFESKWRHNCV